MLPTNINKLIILSLRSILRSKMNERTECDKDLRKKEREREKAVEKKSTIVKRHTHRSPLSTLLH